MMLLARFAATANYGRLPRPVPVSFGRNQVPDGPPTRTPAIPAAFWQDVWDNAQGLPAGLPPVTPNSPDLRTQWDRLYERFGSLTNPSHFVMLRDTVNAVKGRVEGFYSPMRTSRVRTFVREALGGNETSVESFMSPLREVSYFNIRVKRRRATDSLRALQTDCRDV
jgi:chitinase